MGIIGSFGLGLGKDIFQSDRGRDVPESDVDVVLVDRAAGVIDHEVGDEGLVARFFDHDTKAFQAFLQGGVFKGDVGQDDGIESVLTGFDASAGIEFLHGKKAILGVAVIGIEFEGTAVGALGESDFSSLEGGFALLEVVFGGGVFGKEWGR